MTVEPAGQDNLVGYEREILTNRMVLGTFAAFLLFLTMDQPATLLQGFASYMALNGALYAAQKWSILPTRVRWLIAIMLDMGMGLFCMVVEPVVMASVYPIYLWAILGNGFRYGLVWLFVSAAMAIASFSTVIWLVPLWQQNMALSVSLLLALFLIPAYCSTLIRKLSRARTQAEAASRAKSMFLASVSHELRTPLNAIIGYGSHLKQLALPREQRDMVEASVHAGEHLLFLIDQLLQVTANEGSNVRIRRMPFRLTDMLVDARDMVQLRADEKKLAIHLQADPLSDRPQHGPAEPLRNILINLASNAVKFTDAGSITIRCGYDGDEMWMEVEDTGIGVRPDMQDRIFEAFQQGDESVLDRFGGTGLGLAICRQLADQLGGRITLASQPGVGSCFRYTGPVFPVPAETDGAGNEDSALAGAEEDKPVRLLAIGPGAAALQRDTAAMAGTVVEALACDDPDRLEAVLDGINLDRFDLAVIDAALIGNRQGHDPLWQQFARHGVAPVLHGSGVPTLDDIRLRAEFATIIPPGSDFDALRSAIRIGCSFAARTPGAEQAENSARPTSPRRRVLVADDNRTNQAVLCTILTGAGHECVVAADGIEALDLLEREAFDIALFDVNMPRMTGIEACRLWRQVEPRGRHLPILGVTADATAETRKACLDAGMDRRLTKPVNQQVLLTAIVEACGLEPGVLPAADREDAAVAREPTSVVVPLKEAGSPAARGTAPELETAQIDYLLSIGDATFLTDVLNDYCSDVRESQTLLARSVVEGRVEDFRFAAHALKSSSGNISAKAFAAQCTKLEKITEGAFWSDGQRLLAETQTALARVLAEVDRLQHHHRRAATG